MWRITWLGTDDVGRLVLGGFRDLHRLVIRFLDRHDAASAAVKADLPGGPAGQVDQRPAAHVVVDRDDHRIPGGLHRDPNPGAEWQTVAGRRHAVLVEDVAAAGAVAFVMRAIPGRDPGFPGINRGRQHERECRRDDPWKATLDWHGSLYSSRPRDRAVTRLSPLMEPRSSGAALIIDADQSVIDPKSWSIEHSQ
jgi:hypothetical protein